MVNYYNLEEAARLLGTSPEELRKMADRNEIRAFRDRGNLRFRSQDIEERARQLGRGSDPELQPGEAIHPRPTDSPQPKKPAGDVFDFELNTDEGDQVDLGSLVKPDQPSSQQGRGKAAPKGGSDSDVRLIPTGSDVDFEINPDSDVKMVKEPPPPSSSRQAGPKRKTSANLDRQEDSGVRIVPLESDSDVQMMPDPAEESAVSLGAPGPRSASDSDIRLHQEPSSTRRPASGKAKTEPPVTEEIDLDAELRQAGGGPASRGPKGKSQLKTPAGPLPTGSPFELSDADLEAKKQGPAKKGPPDSSSDFDLTPLSSRGKKDAADDDDEVTLGELTGRGSGINLQDPADSGISLEQSSSGDDIELELSLDAGATPKPAAQQAPTDSSNEFELSLDAGNTPAPSKASGTPAVDDSDSEFELSLDSDDSASSSEASAESDSEFELTLDDSGGLAPMEGEEEDSEERDIFDTDFEVPALDEESGSQAVALDDADTDLESSDFDIALGEDDAAAEDESVSQVVTIPEEEEDEVAVTRPRRRRVDDDEEAVIEDEDEVSPGRAAAVAAPTQWGALPAILMIPCVILMFLVGLMSFELVRGMWGHQTGNRYTSLVTDSVARMFTDDLPPK